MSTKHVFSSADGLVVKSLRGAVALNPSLRLHSLSKSVYIHSPSPNARVAVISGGGAGHEPAHASYTGRGMLSASVSGDIFASPSAKQILTAIHFTAFAQGNHGQPRDVLVIINNYTGDRLNFGLAIEKARAEGIKIESVVVADDVSLLEETSLVGRRGLAGNILVCKILGALAEQGADLELVKAVGDSVVSNLASVGVGLEHCHVPGRSKEKMTLLEDNVCEIGLGLHNEPGVKKYTLAGAEDLISNMLDLILQSKGNRAFAQEGHEVVLFMNNLGGISQLELGAILDEVLEQLGRMNIPPSRIYLSSYMTSLNAPGFSVSLLNLHTIKQALQDNTKTTYNVDILQLLDHPTEALAWVGIRSHWPRQGLRSVTLVAQAEESEKFLASFATQSTTSTSHQTSFWRTADISPEAVKNGVLGSCAAVLEIESELTRCDTVVGDGDCGVTLGAGARAIIKEIGDSDVGKLGPSELTQKIADVLEDAMGGTIGALFAIFFTALSMSLKAALSSADIPQALDKALGDLAAHTPAKPGDRTVIDALRPFCDALKAGKGIEESLAAAKKGAEATRQMKPRLGRAVYVGTDSDELPPDPGALGVCAILEGFVRPEYANKRYV